MNHGKFRVMAVMILLALGELVLVKVLRLVLAQALNDTRTGRKYPK